MADQYLSTNPVEHYPCLVMGETPHIKARVITP